MYNRKKIDELIEFIKENKDKSKSELTEIVVSKFSLKKSRSVFYNEYCAIRFSVCNKKSFSNTVLSLSALKKHDHLPFIVCVLTLEDVFFRLANTSFLSKISHSSHKLTLDKIRGSFNGTDIVKMAGSLKNEETNFAEMFAFHQEISFEKNLERLVEESNQIKGTRKKFLITIRQEKVILNSVSRTIDFLNSRYYKMLEKDLNDRVLKVKDEIVMAFSIDNVNIRGRVIEYLITHVDSDETKKEIIFALRNNKELPAMKTENDLGDYNVDYGNYKIKTDIKTKILALTSAPKAYNIDKLLEFLSEDKTIYLIYFVGIDFNKKIKTFLCSPFNNTLLNITNIQIHWAGRNSRGVAQFMGHSIDEILRNKNCEIDRLESKKWLKKLIKH